MEGPNHDPVGHLDEKILLREHNLDEGKMGSYPNPNATDDMKTHAGGNNGKKDQPSYNPPKQVRGGGEEEVF
jgi:hypothetical protein